MSKKILLCFNLFIATAMCNSNVLTNWWLDYIVTVETPVSFFTLNGVTRKNGSCCSPMDPTDCTICPDDPNVEFKLYVCFRRGFVRGYNEDANYCPLGGVDFTPNTAPGPWHHLTAHPEAGSLPKQYPGSVQLYVRITAISNGAEIHTDDVWVYGENIPADGVLRRICYLSFTHIAVVCVNTRVQCVNGAVTPDCSIPTLGPTTPTIPTAATTINTTTTTTAATTTTPTVATDNSTQSTTVNSRPKQNDKVRVASPALTECVGVGFAAGAGTAILLTLIMSMLTFCICKYSTRKGFCRVPRVEENVLLQRNNAYTEEQRLQLNNSFVEEEGLQRNTFIEEEVKPVENHTFMTGSTELKEPDQPIYEQITCVHIP